MAVYRNNHQASLMACLEDSFARTRDWIGGDAFAAAAVRHIERVPPGSWTLDAYPRDFPDTLELLYPDDPEIGELAWLECALGEAFVAPDADPVTPEAAAAIDWDHAILHFSPTLDMRDIRTNAAILWSAMTAGEDPPTVEHLPESGVLIVWRQAMVSRFRTIDQVEARTLRLARSGRSFPALCAMLVVSFGEADGIALAGQFLGRWLGDGLLAGVKTG